MGGKKLQSNIDSPVPRKNLPVGLLEAGAGATTTELLGFTAARVRNKERPVELHERLLDLPLGGLVNILLVVGNDSLGDGLAHRCTSQHQNEHIMTPAQIIGMSTASTQA